VNKLEIGTEISADEENIMDDEKGHAQIFLDRPFQSFGQPGCLRQASSRSPLTISVARLTLPCGLWMINSWKRVVSSLIIPWVVAI
jgi:hypothetical protein